MSEKGTITAVGVSKGGPATISASLSNLPSISDVKTRCTNVYTKNRQTGTLKKVKASSSFAGVTHEPNSGSNLGGKTLEYSYDFTDDPEVFEAGTFSRKKVKSNDSM